jgi:hypothetical protein
MIPSGWNKIEWDAFKRTYPKTYMIRLHHVKKTDPKHGRHGTRADKIAVIKNGLWNNLDQQLINWALENADDAQINKWYMDSL